MMYSEKPSKLQRVSNMRHKKYHEKQYKLIKLRQVVQFKPTDADLDNCDDEDKTVNGQPSILAPLKKEDRDFNFKKTTANKYKYSCGGYGGRCNMCKGYKDNGKNQQKMTIIIPNQEKQLTISLPSSITRY